MPKRMKSGHSLTPYTKIYSEWIKDLNVRLNTIKVLEENMRILFGIKCRKIFLDPPPRVMKKKGGDLIKQNHKKKRIHRMGENICK